MIWVIIIIIIIIIVFKVGSYTGQAVGSVNNDGGMRTKYARLLELILQGHNDSKIFVETRTYIRAGVSNYGGNTIFHIQQCPGNKVMIDYEVSRNPAIKDFTLHFTFDDSMDQDEMMNQIVSSMLRKMM
mgnify:CR=1 FL=1